jgi:hypothetical protein
MYKNKTKKQQKTQANHEQGITNAVEGCICF